jgi:hypothetical protein
MNIFLVSNSPDECAQALDDLRLNKMILETGQMLCTAYRHYAKQYGWPAEFPGIYKETHKNHPCNVWLRENINNYKWTLHLFENLAVEKQLRSGKLHLTYSKLIAPLCAVPHRFNYTEPKFTFDCSNTQAKLSSVFANYKLCLTTKWNLDKRPPTWANRGFPEWVKLAGSPGHQYYQLNNVH